MHRFFYLKIATFPLMREMILYTKPNNILQEKGGLK